MSEIKSRQRRTGGGNQGINPTAEHVYYITTPPPLSNNTSLHIANLYGELADFWLDRCKTLVNSGDGEFNYAFERAIFFCGLVDHFWEVGNGR